MLRVHFVPSSNTNIFSSHQSITLPLFTYTNISTAEHNYPSHLDYQKLSNKNIGKEEITIIHHSPEMHWSSHMVDIWESNSVQRCNFTFKVTGRLLLEVGFFTAVGCQRSALDYVPHTLADVSFPSRGLYKSSTHPLLPQLVVYYFSSPLNFCFKKYGTKSTVWPLSFST